MGELMPAPTPELVFLKLGGSLITDKQQAYTARPEVLARLAREVREALEAAPHLRVLLGHGSGSFGHWAALPYGTRQGVHTTEQWKGFVEVAAAAANLNRIVTDAFIAAGVAALSLQPSASARCRGYALEHLNAWTFSAALERRLVPVVYGDVAFDDVHGGTICSTEDLFLFLARDLHPARVLLLGAVAGVLNTDGEVVSRITPASLRDVEGSLAGSAAVDVTGGMADKVRRMLALVRRHPATRVHILSGAEPGLLSRALRDPATPAGTLITAL